MSTKTKTIYICTECSSQLPKWMGQCSECQAWNCVVEDVIAVSGQQNLKIYSNFNKELKNKVHLLSEVSIQASPRILTQSNELDRVLGGGLVFGSVILIGGDPGIGKSTLLLQVLCQMSQEKSVLYVTGEESLYQVSLRAKRLELIASHLKLLAETQVESILTIAQQEQPSVIVIDSIQTMTTQMSHSTPGSVSQVRESAAQLVRYAKQTGTALIIVGHVTKQGAIAGPRILEHMVDTVLYFEGDRSSRFRMIRAVKNRFGTVNELGVFAMTDKGLREVKNPSSMFLSRDNKPVCGSIVMATWEGTRPILVEIQALVNESHLENPRRITVGLEKNRLAMLLAVLHRHANIATYNQDVFINAVGGMRVLETGADLPILLAVISSLKNNILPLDLIAFGEVGLSGEIRPVQSGQERLREAFKHGFKRAIIPKANAPKKPWKGMEIIAVGHVTQILHQY